jgi:hypothetical protein
MFAKAQNVFYKFHKQTTIEIGVGGTQLLPDKNNPIAGLAYFKSGYHFSDRLMIGSSFFLLDNNGFSKEDPFNTNSLTHSYQYGVLLRFYGKKNFICGTPFIEVGLSNFISGDKKYHSKLDAVITPGLIVWDFKEKILVNISFDAPVNRLIMKDDFLLTAKLGIATYF